MRKVPTKVWQIWLMVVSIGFFALELAALVTKEQGDTLSENVRRWLQVHDIDVPTKKTRAAVGGGVVGVLIGLLVWFVPHIATASWGVVELIPSLLVGGAVGAVVLGAMAPKHVPPLDKE